MKFGRSIPYSQALSKILYPEPIRFNFVHCPVFKAHSNIDLASTSRPSKIYLFLVNFFIKIFKELPFTFVVKCTPYLSLINLIKLAKLTERLLTYTNTTGLSDISRVLIYNLISDNKWKQSIYNANS